MSKALPLLQVSYKKYPTKHKKKKKKKEKSAIDTFCRKLDPTIAHQLLPGKAAWVCALRGHGGKEAKLGCG